MTRICKHCSVQVTVDDPQGVKSGVSCSKSSPCKSCVEMEDLESAIAKLKMEQHELKRNINVINSPFIRLIPPEIIAKISGFVIADFTIRGRLSDGILLSSVCSDWRRAVVGTPELWSSIKINLPSISQTSDSEMAGSNTLPRLATFIDEWLSRSGQLPLNITICYGYHDWDDRDISDLLTEELQEQYRQIFKILDQCSSRWRSLNIFIPPTLLQLLQRPDHLPMLEQLRIASCMTDPKPIIDFPPASCLTTVEIRQFRNYKYSISPFIGIHWDTVTHFSIQSISRDTLLEFLSKNPQLVQCTIRKVCSNSRLNPSPIVSSESLTYLSIHHNSGPFQVLDCITLPCLETLVLGSITSNNSNPIISFLKRSACSLHTLSLLSCHDKHTDQYLPLLHFLSPSLKRLAISRNMSTKIGTQGYLSLLSRIHASQSESLLTRIYTSQVEESLPTRVYTSPFEAPVGDGFLPHLEIFEYRKASLSTLEIPMLPSRNHPKKATSIPLHSVYISLDSIRDMNVLHDILLTLRRLKEEKILTYN